MSKGNSDSIRLVRCLEEARDALDVALKALKKGRANARPSKVAAVGKLAPRSASALDFTMPLRPFVKRHGPRLNGAKKLTLLVAYLTKGDNNKTVSLAEIESHWNKMTAKGLLGVKFNRLYTSQARENDWVSTEKVGTYRLRPSWKAIFNA